jgi:hypothetical protein
MHKCFQRLRVTSVTTNNPRRRPGVSKRDWAHVVDVNKELVNFHELVPDMARTVSQGVLAYIQGNQKLTVGVSSTRSSSTRFKKRRCITLNRVTVYSWLLTLLPAKPLSLNMPSHSPRDI